MKLKLLAPFKITGFKLNTPRVLQEPREYERAWEHVARTLPPDLSNVFAPTTSIVSDCRLTHASPYCERVGSRYRSIETHSLPRPLQVLELEIDPPAEHLVSLLDVARGELKRCRRGIDSGAADRMQAALAELFQAAPLRCLVRVYDHRIALLEIDLPVPDEVLQQAQKGSGEVAPALDALQQLGIEFGEALVDDLHDTALSPLFTWLRSQEALNLKYLHAEAEKLNDGEEPQEVDRSATDSRALWVTRTLVFEAIDEITPAAGGAISASGRAIVSHWLKDLADAEDAIRECCNDPAAFSTSWLNYLLREEAYAGAYPQHGWRYFPALNDDREPATGTNGQPARPRARPLCPVWDAMLIAQYYDAAFDQLQSEISRILAISLDGHRWRDVARAKASLDRAVREANMLKLEYEENRKFYARKVAAHLDEILNGWNFEGDLVSLINQRLEDCDKRLGELHGRAVERSSIYTDLILAVIGVIAVFEILLYLAEYGRATAADPDLAVYESTTWNLASWLGRSSTDAILFAGAAFSIVLTLAYGYFRIKKLRT